MKTSMRKRLTVIGICAGLVVLAVVVLVALRPRLSGQEKVQYRTVPVGYADISATVTETGTVNPVNEILVGSEVSGTIKAINVDFNSKVKAGQVLAVIDSTTFQAAVDSATADLALAEASARSAEVNVGKMKDTLDLANLTEQREEPLVKDGFAAQSQLDTDRTAAETANQDYLAAQAALQVAQAQVTVARSQLAQARYNLSRAVITSPIDGIVMARNVSVGQTVAASLQTPTLFLLATSLTDTQVDTSVDEADVGSVRPGQAAQISVTAYPNVTFSGTVQEVRVNPTVVQNVVTYDAVVQVHDTTGRLMPGMTAQVTIEADQQAHVLSVPVAALLYRPLAARAPSSSGGLAAAGGAALASAGGAAAAMPVAGAPGSRVTVWVLSNGRPAAVPVVIGLSDGKNVQITAGGLHEGDAVIVAQRTGGAGFPSGSSPARSSPAGSSPAVSSPAASSPAASSPAASSGQSAPSGQSAGGATGIAASSSAMQASGSRRGQ